MLEINLRRATIGDVDTLFEIEKELGETETYVRSKNRQEIEEEINNKNCVVYLIEVDGKVVGDASYEVKSPTHTYFTDLMVAPSHQGKGVGKKVMEMILKELEERNIVYKEKRGKKNLVFLKK